LHESGNSDETKMFDDKIIYVTLLNINVHFKPLFLKPRAKVDADRISFYFYFSAPENAFFIFRRFIFQPKTTSAFSFLSFFGTKLAVKKTKKKKVSTLAELIHGGQNSESPAVAYSAAVYVANHRAWVLWGSKHWAVSRLSLLSLLLQSACVNSTSRQKILVGATNKCCHEQLISAAGQIYSDCRSSLLGENAKKLSFLEYNIRLFDFKYWSLHTERLTYSERYSRLKCELVIMGLSSNIFFSCVCYFMLIPTSANHNRNHNQICIASRTELQRRWMY